MSFLNPALVIALACAFVFYGAGKTEAKGGGRDNALLWALLSLALAAPLVLWLKVGWITMLLAQVGLFVGIGVFRAFRE